MCRAPDWLPQYLVSLWPNQDLLMHLFRDMERVLTYFTGFLTFILSFFNSITYSRWWKMRELCGGIIKRTVNTLRCT